MKFSNCRGIIIKNNKLVVMERKKNGRHYYTFPGGHVEKMKLAKNALSENLWKNSELVSNLSV